MKIDGSCQCGSITYEAEADEHAVGICHCTDCQKFSGSAFRVGVPVTEQSFKLLSGTLKVYVKTAASGGKREQVFCPDCGTHLYSTSVKEGDTPRMFRVRVPTANQASQLIPSTQGWFRSAQKWVTGLDAIPSRPQQ
ncbi:MAG: hypothetical protein ACI9MJ_002779 [Alphaproteobacteria bacterium]|jgi:hypothetical protein